MEQSIIRQNTTALAYLGDAVYEVYIRRRLIERYHCADVNRMHRAAVKYVSAEGQALAVRGLMRGFLTEEEQQLVKRARNRRSVSRPRNADPKDYKLATGLEALIGALYLSEDLVRMKIIMAEALRIIEEQGESK